jgi:hypothetical protein
LQISAIADQFCNYSLKRLQRDQTMEQLNPGDIHRCSSEAEAYQAILTPQC